MCMRESKILYNWQLKLAQNLAKLQGNTFVTKFSGIWQHSTQKTASTVKMRLFKKKKSDGKGLTELTNSRCPKRPSGVYNWLECAYSKDDVRQLPGLQIENGKKYNISHQNCTWRPFQEIGEGLLR